MTANPTPIISRQEAAERKLTYRVTMPDRPDSKFIKNACADMNRIPGTVWSLVDTGGGLVEVWRIPLDLTSEILDD